MRDEMREETTRVKVGGRRGEDRAKRNVRSRTSIL